MSETSDFPRCRSTEDVTCRIEGGNGDRKPTEHKHTPQKERKSGRRGKKTRGSKKACGISDKFSISCSVFTFVQFLYFRCIVYWRRHLFVYVYICMYVGRQVVMYTCMQVRIHKRTYIYIYTRKHMCEYILCTSIYTRVHNQRISRLVNVGDTVPFRKCGFT